MSQNSGNNPLGLEVEFVAKQLTDQELAALNIVMQSDTDPRRAIGYKKAESLFNQQKGGIPVAHRGVKDIFAQIVLSRLSH